MLNFDRRSEPTNRPDYGPRSDQSLRHQRFIGTDDRVARHLELFGEAAARRQAEAARKLTGGDGLTELACELIGEVLDAGAVEQQRQLHASSLSDSFFVAMQQRRWTHGSDVNRPHRAFGLCSRAQG